MSLSRQVEMKAINYVHVKIVAIHVRSGFM